MTDAVKPSVGDDCHNCRGGRLYYDGGLVRGVSHLACFACGWRPEAVQAGRMPPRETFWLTAEARGVSRAQFDLEWDEYQRSKLPSVNHS
ncbi:MAG TPA: hypothetical protein VM639_24595 [Dongiaceae bacterium]|nr:hypothetical protein [Dongiaceae bacterium]